MIQIWRINNTSASGWVIRDTNETIKKMQNKHVGNASIIIAKCEALRDGVLTARFNDFSNLEIKAGTKVIIDCYNKIVVFVAQLLFNGWYGKICP